MRKAKQLLLGVALIMVVPCAVFAAAVVVRCGVGKTSPRTSIMC